MTESINTLITLGSGTSTGLPILGCKCSVCTHPDPKNKRLRSSIFLKTAKKQGLLVDAGPDLRTQLLRENINSLEGLILTHEHADHAHGIDDLRPLSFSRKSPIPVYTYRRTIKAMTEKFAYIFKRHETRIHPPSLAGSIPQLDFVEVSPGCTSIGEEIFEFFSNPHGPMETLAFIHGQMAYIVDCHEISQNNLQRLREKQLDLLILDCVRPRPHGSHLHLDKALEYAEVISPRSCALTHLGHEFEHNELSQKLKKALPFPVFPLYDGQVLTYGV